VNYSEDHEIIRYNLMCSLYDDINYSLWKMGKMHWIYLSPHLDDVVLSCGGLIWQQVQAGDQVEIWTICAGDSPTEVFSPLALELHERWQTGPDAPAQRRQEDIEACKRVGATPRHFEIPDCIYRRSPVDDQFMYARSELINGEPHPHDHALIHSLSEKLSRELPDEWNIVCPLTLGGHIDHRLVRKAAESMGRISCYYADYPYIQFDGVDLKNYLQPEWEQVDFQITDAALKAWIESIAAYRSQLSSFWENEAEMDKALTDYRDAGGGSHLWFRGK
jgi:LmbE family N-acetylglucosaminyl deacetylase